MVELIIKNNILIKIENYNGERSITIPNGVTKIGVDAFLGCRELTSITIPNSVTEIGDNAFAGCSALTSITIPNSVTKIGDHTFFLCKRLTSINIPNSVIKIDDCAFSGCDGLTSIIIPNSVKEIGEDVFGGCIGLKSATIPNSVIEIGENAFAHCSALTSVTIPNSVTEIRESAFYNCCALTSITIPNSVIEIGEGAFYNCSALKSVTIPNSVIKMDNSAFDFTNFKYVYFTKDGKNFVLSSEINENLEKTCYRRDFKESEIKNKNFKENYVNLLNLKEQGEIKFIPSVYTMAIFPSSEITKFFVNNNNQRWGKLVKTLGFDTLEGTGKNNSLVDLMKIYYAIGGFSENQGESEKAFDYILNYVAVSKNSNASPSVIGAEIHARFSRIELKDAYNPIFAQFFMKYYHDNPDFMNFRLKDKDDELMDSQDYLCACHNAFNSTLKNYPNRSVNGNEERSLLSPRFLAEHSGIVEYEYVKEGNELLAEIVGKYGYTEEQFEQIQKSYEQAKKIKNNYIIKADKASENDCVKFRILEKDDPLGFVLGDITNCCQVFGGAGKSCVDDGYTNPNAGFLVFEESITDEQGELTCKTRILGQAYIWYDPKTKTVCYDNIEIPKKILNELRSGDKQAGKISSKSLLDAVEHSAEAIMRAMNKNEIKVERVTTGEGYNDLVKELEKRYGAPKQNPNAQNRNYNGYSDAREAQFIIKTYDEVTNCYANKIRNTASKIRNDLSEMRFNVENQRTA